MKKIKLPGLPFPVWVVEFDNCAKYQHIEDPDVENDLYCRIWYEKEGLKRSIHIPVNDEHLYDSIKFIGKLSDLTEQQFERLVHIDGEGSSYKLYVNYLYSDRTCDLAKESFISAIQVEGYSVMDCDMAGHVKTQEKVIDLNRCYLFVKI